MSDAEGDTGDVGSVAEEAAKLLGALHGWARDHGAEAPGSPGSTAGAAAGILHDLDEHIATGGRDCRYCPVCQAIATVRATSPEVRQHLSTAATSLLHAATGLLEAYAQRATAPPSAGAPDRHDPVERIDLSDDASDDDWEGRPWG